MKASLLMLVATLGLQAQSSSSAAGQTPSADRQPPQTVPSGSAASGNSSSSSQLSSPGASASGSQVQSDQQRQDQDRQRDRERQRNEGNLTSRTQSTTPGAQDSSNSSIQSHSSTTQSTQAGTQTHVAVTGETDVQVQTVVQQIDAQGPVVVERISSHFADVACSQENARLLVEALHNGASVTLRGDDGKTATFTPNVKLGYGEAYMAMALAAEALQKAGITGCASPEQWQAVLMGGQLSGGVATTTVQTERFPGILVLHSQGGWTKVAQTTNIELNQVVSQANTSLQIDHNSQQLSPTGRSGDYDPFKGEEKKHDANQHDLKSKDASDPAKADPARPDASSRQPGQEMNPPAADDPNNPARTEQPQARPNR